MEQCCGTCQHRTESSGRGWCSRKNKFGMPEIVYANDSCGYWEVHSKIIRMMQEELERQRLEHERAEIERKKREERERQKQAINRYTEELRNNPNSASAYYNRSVLYKENDNINAALADLEKAVNLEPTNDNYHEAFIKVKAEQEAAELKRKEENRKKEEAEKLRLLREAKKKKQIIIATVCAVVTVMALVAFIVYRSTGSFFEFKNNAQGTLIITGYSGTKEVVIPASNKGIRVTEIGNNAFYNKKLISVVIPDGITAIGDNAFSSNQLTSVAIPYSVITIGEFAFNGNQLRSITIPNGVSSIKRSVFYGNPLTSVVIPDSVTTIGRTAFYGNRLTNVVIPNSVTSIGEDSFTGHQLTSITIGGNVTLDPVKGSFGEEGFVTYYNDGGKRAGIYTRPNTKSATWTRQRNSGQSTGGQISVLPSSFVGTWKRDNFNNTLTLTINTVKSSSQSYYWTVVSLSDDDTLTISDGNRVNYTAKLSIWMENGNIEIGDDSGNGDNNWNGTWRRQ